MQKIAVIGSGFSGLSTSAYLASAGYEVHVFEKMKLPVVELGNLEPKQDTYLIWDQVGIGCPMYLKNF